MASERNLMGGQRTPRPRALVWDLFGDHLRYVGDGRIPMRALSALLDVFGVGDSTSRVVLARMRREGWLDTCRSGRLSSYTLTGRALALLDEGRSRIFGRGTSAWDGLWRMVVYAVPSRTGRSATSSARVLEWYGFGPLVSATWISPHPRLDVIAEALQERSAGRFDLLESRAPDRAVDREMARRCWDLDELAREYAGLLARYEMLSPLTALAALPGGSGPAPASRARHVLPDPALPRPGLARRTAAGAVSRVWRDCRADCSACWLGPRRS
jgi:phenylacetic acid degradation operon negative regulatory protein